MQRFKSYINRTLGPDFTPQEIRLYSRILLQEIGGLSSVQLLTDKDKDFPEDMLQTLCKAVDRIASHEPVQYIVGKTAFYGRDFLVGEGVLIPRPETEELVDLVLKKQSEWAQSEPAILDIGTGSGCIAISLAASIHGSKVEGWDISEEALKIARLNAESMGVPVTFKLEDVLSEHAKLQYQSALDLIISNPPYVCRKESSEMEKHVLEFEPHTALFVEDSDPLVFYRAIASIAFQGLKKNGMLFFEINRSFGRETVDEVLRAGFRNAELLQDISGNDRFVLAKR